MLIELWQSTDVVERLNCNLLDPLCRWLFRNLDKSVNVVLFDELKLRRRPRKVPKSSQKLHSYNVAVEENTQVSQKHVAKFTSALSHLVKVDLVSEADAKNLCAVCLYLLILGQLQELNNL